MLCLICAIRVSSAGSDVREFGSLPPAHGISHSSRKNLVAVSSVALVGRPVRQHCSNCARARLVQDPACPSENILRFSAAEYARPARARVSCGFCSIRLPPSVPPTCLSAWICPVRPSYTKKRITTAVFVFLLISYLQYSNLRIENGKLKMSLFLLASSIRAAAEAYILREFRPRCDSYPCANSPFLLNSSKVESRTRQQSAR